MKQITDLEEINKICEDVLVNNPKMVAQFKGGKQKVFRAILGQVAKVTNNKANMGMVDKVLKELLKK